MNKLTLKYVVINNKGKRVSPLFGSRHECYKYIFDNKILGKDGEKIMAAYANDDGVFFEIDDMKYVDYEFVSKIYA